MDLEHYMIVRLTRLLLCFQAVVAAVLFITAIKVWGIESWWLALILSIGLVLLCRISITANSFFLASVYGSETPLIHRLTWRQALHMFIGEFHATMLSTSWTMPFCSFTKRAMRMPVGLPVLLIHGYGCNSGYWHAMSKALSQASITHHAINLEPVLASIDTYAPLVRRAVEALCNASGHQQVIIVGHSMGGLAARAYLRMHASRQVAKIITIGTPHHGTGIANHGAGINCQQMRWQGNSRNGKPSDWLHELDASEDQAIRALFVSLYSHHDNIVAPQTSSFLKGAKNIEFGGIGHVAMALNPEVHACVIEEIRRASQQA